MKKLIIAAIAIAMIAGSASAQDNKVKVVKQNTELIKRAKTEKVTTKGQVAPKVKLEKTSVLKADTCKKITPAEGKIQPGRTLKPKTEKKVLAEPKKLNPIKGKKNVERK